MLGRSLIARQSAAIKTRAVVQSPSKFGRQSPPSNRKERTQAPIRSFSRTNCQSASQLHKEPPPKRRRATPIQRKGFEGRPYLSRKAPGDTELSGATPTKKGSAMLKDDIAYLLKFAPREAYIDDLINGHLYMNAAGCYHGLPGEQGDPLEASMAPGRASTDTLACQSTACIPSARTTSSATP